MYAYIDESGDTGMTLKSSKFFTMTAVIVNDNLKLERDIRKYMLSLLKINKSRPRYFHAYKESIRTKKKLIELSIKNNAKVISFVYSKKTKDMYIKSLYKMLTFLESKNVNNIYIASYISNKVFIQNLNENFPSLELKVTPASNNWGLQMADCYSYFIYNTLNNKVLNKEEVYMYSMIKDIIHTKQNP